MKHITTSYCKIKDSSLNLELKTVEPSKINKLGRTIVNIRQSLRKLANVPDRVRVVKLSNHLSGGGKKDLTKAILTEINHFKGKQVIKTKTEINNRFLKPI